MNEPILTNDEESYEKIERKAKRRVKDLKDFYTHIAIYTLVNVFLLGLNLMEDPDSLWAIWPIAGWGIGLIIHAVSVFGLFGIGSKEWEERKVRELILQSQKGLTEDQMRSLLREELSSGQDQGQGRIIRRLEHLEAIVTSQEWDLLEESDRLKTDALRNKDEDNLTEDPEGEVKRIARRVR